jgi:hypothetical protein
MRQFIRGGFLMMALVAVGAGTAFAQSDQGSISDQFKNGAQSIGQGASSIGEGIKQGAVKTWDAVKTGAQAASDKFNETPASKPSAAPPPPAPPAPPVEAAPLPPPSSN